MAEETLIPQRFEITGGINGTGRVVTNVTIAEAFEKTIAAELPKSLEITNSTKLKDVISPLSGLVKASEETEHQLKCSNAVDYFRLISEYVAGNFVELLQKKRSQKKNREARYVVEDINGERLDTAQRDELIKACCICTSTSLFPMTIPKPGYPSYKVQDQIFENSFLMPRIQPLFIKDKVFLKVDNGIRTNEATKIFLDSSKRKESPEKSGRYYLIVLGIGRSSWTNEEQDVNIFPNSDAYVTKNGVRKESKKGRRYFPHKLEVSRKGLNKILKAMKVGGDTNDISHADRVEYSIGAYLAAINSLAGIFPIDCILYMGSTGDKKTPMLYMLDFGLAQKLCLTGLRNKEDIQTQKAVLTEIKRNYLYPTLPDAVVFTRDLGLRQYASLFDVNNKLFVLGYNCALLLIKTILVEERGAISKEIEYANQEDVVQESFIIQSQARSSPLSRYCFVAEYIDALKIDPSRGSVKEIVLPNPIDVSITGFANVVYRAK